MSRWPLNDVRPDAKYLEIKRVSPWVSGGSCLDFPFRAKSDIQTLRESEAQNFLGARRLQAGRFEGA